MASPAAAATRLRLAPQTARQARLLRLANHLVRTGEPGAPTTEADKLLWARSQERAEADKRLSREEERLRAPLLRAAASNDASNIVSHSKNNRNLFQYREYPMYPGEYVPPEHDTLSTVRSELRADLTAQSIKDAWLRVSGGKLFAEPGQFYGAVDGLEEGQLADIVAALFPDLTDEESASMVRRILDSISTPSTGAVRTLASTVTAESLGLDQAPEHYTNFLEWMSRMTSTRAFATENSIYQFCRRAFNRKDVHTMYNNYDVLSPDAIKSLSADGYSHFYHVLKDYAVRVAGTDTRHQIGVRIDPREADEGSGISVAFGRNHETELGCLIRHNEHGQGQMYIQGKTIQEFTDHRATIMERILAPLDEAGLHYRDFDIAFINRGGVLELETSEEILERFAIAAQFALANAVTRLMPLTRIPIKKAGYLSFDRRKTRGDFQGFLDLKSMGRSFSKRARKS